MRHKCALVMISFVCYRKAIHIVRDSFVEYAVVNQDFLGSDTKVKKVLALIPDDRILSLVNVIRFLNKGLQGVKVRK